MLVCSAESGNTFDTKSSLYEIARRGSLRDFVSEVTGIDSGSAICFLSDGQQLRDENIRQLAGAPEDTIYVFNRDYLFLDTELSDVIRDLELPLAITGDLLDTSTPDEFMASAEQHITYLPPTISSFAVQMSALRVAASNLDQHVLSLSEVFENFEMIAVKELDRQAILLRNHNLDLEIISKIRVHHEFLSPNVRKEVEAGLKERMLVDYISGQKMKLVVDSCSKLHDELNYRFSQVQSSMATLTSGADDVRGCVTPDFRDKAETIQRRAVHSFNRLRDLFGNLKRDSPSSSTTIFDISALERSIRKDVEDLNGLKNASTAHVLTVLRQVSFLQSTLAEVPSALTGLETDLRSRGGFAHMQRLHNMVYMYGATIIEVVRRKEFAKFFAERAQVIAEVMARLSSNERKRRQTYRGEVHGQLPFDNKGMDEPTPAMEVTTVGQADSLFSLTKEDVTLFMEALEQIERSTIVPTVSPSIGQPSPDDRPVSVLSHVVPHPMKETRAALEKLISRIEGLSAEFDRLVERSVLSPDRMVHSKRRSESDASAYRGAIDQLREMRDAHAAREQAALDDRESTTAEIRRFRLEHEAELQGGRERMRRLEDDLTSIRSVLDREVSARASIEARHADLLITMEDKERKLQVALADATQRTKDAEILSRELERARAEADEHNRAQSATDERLTAMLAEQSETLRKLEEARVQGEDLEEQIKFARAEGDEAFRALNEATREKDRLLRTQSLEADRLLRDHIAEADGDRAVLEHQFSELHAAHESTARELKEALSELEVCRADLGGLRHELARAQYESSEALDLQSNLRDEILRARSAHDDQARRLTSADHMVADMLDVAVSFRDTNARLLSSIQKTLSQASKSSQKQSLSIVDSIAGLEDGRIPQSFARDVARTQDALAAYTTPIDWSDPAASIEILKRFNLEAFSETVLKSGTTIRKWQKQCKEYRDRAREKISFRNFTKGDLALFLPTRNSVAKPWAAFNVSFPHYFLKPTPQVAAQLENREWKVARITSITERIVDPRDLASNPFGLASGVKFYMLEVEDYAQPVLSQRRTVSAPIRGSPESNIGSKERNVSWTAGAPPPVSELPSTDNIDALPMQSSASHPRNLPKPSSSPSAGPSSLSRLLAQASSDPTNQPAISSTAIDPSPPSSDGPRSQPVSPFASKPRSRTASGHSHSLIRPSLIPASSGQPNSHRSNGSLRSSTAVSNALPAVEDTPAGSAKGIPTTALADDAILEGSPIPPQLVALPSTSDLSSSYSTPPPEPSPLEHNPLTSETPSPTGSASEGLASMLISRSRKRTISSKGLASSSPPVTSTLANLASNWRIPLSRRRNDSTPTALSSSPPSVTGSLMDDGGSGVSGTIQRGKNDARSLLRKLDSIAK